MAALMIHTTASCISTDVIQMERESGCFPEKASQVLQLEPCGDLSVFPDLSPVVF